MKNGRPLIVLVLLVAQVLVWNYFNLSQFVLLTFLPTMVICLPARVNTTPALLITFLTGIAVDFFTHGILGLTCVALLPIAFGRKFIISLVFGEEIFSRGEGLSFRRQGFLKMSLAIVLSTALFMIIYVWVDGAGMRPFWFNALRFVCSLAASSFVSLFVASLLTEEESARWK